MAYICRMHHVSDASDVSETTQTIGVSNDQNLADQVIAKIIADLSRMHNAVMSQARQVTGKKRKRMNNAEDDDERV